MSQKIVKKLKKMREISIIANGYVLSLVNQIDSGDLHSSIYNINQMKIISVSLIFYIIVLCCFNSINHA